MHSPSFRSTDVCSTQDLRLSFSGPERLVGIGFRCWLAGYETCDINCWETGWRIYASELGPDQAKMAITELACWMRAVSSAASRKIEYYPVNCTEFCHDEYLSVAMIAAGQSAAFPALKACASRLTGSVNIEEIEKTACNFGSALKSAGIELNTQILSVAERLTENRVAFS